MSATTKGTVNIHGKEYETVASRVQRFRAENSLKYSIETELVDRDDSSVVMKACIRDLISGNVVATGYAEENRQASQINRTSALENCETSAIGRALAAFGMAGTEYASADEVAQAITQQAAPMQPTAPVQGTRDVPLATEIEKRQVASFLTAAGFDTPDKRRKQLVDHYGFDPDSLTKAEAKIVMEDLK